MGEAKEAERRLGRIWRVFDVGNSHVKTGNFKNGRLGSSLVWSSSKPFPEVHDADFDGAFAAVASVNPAALNRVLESIPQLGATTKVVLPSDGAIFQSGLVTTDLETPETTGVDRVLGCLGASLETPDRTIIVVDCGTATTVNVMTADRCFRGGMIAPGRRLLAKALHEGTAALPEAAIDTAELRIGKSTQQSLSAGIAAAMIGGIRECVSSIQRSHPDVVVFLTGGDSEFAAHSFPEFRRSESLTLYGLHWFAAQKVDGLK